MPELYGASAPKSTENGQHSHGKVAPDQRFTHGRSCPICGGSDDARRGAGERCFGYISDDGAWCHCSREEHAGRSALNPLSQTFPHLLKGRCPCGTEHAPADPKPAKPRAKSQAGRVVASYPYRGLDGRLLFEVMRFNPKGFRQRRPVDGGWEWNLKGVEPVLYRLPELTAADPSRTVFVGEGEKGVGALVELGLVATCSPMGAGKWRPAYAEHLRGRHVVILPDNDKPGRDHAETVAQSLHGVAASVKVVELRGLPEKGDAFDWVKAGGTAAQLQELVDATPSLSPDIERNGRHRGNGKASAGQIAPVAHEHPRFPLTDAGNGERFAHHFRGLVRYCIPIGKWYAYDGRRWLIDNNGVSVRKAKQTARAILRDAADLEDDDERAATVKWAKNSESKTRLEAMLWCAGREEGVPVLPEDLDRDPWLLNCLNGTVDLKTGELRPHDPADLITCLCPVEYHPEAECPTWRATLTRVFNGNRDLIGYWRRLCGLATTGSVQEQILPIPYGAGANGKSTLLGALLRMLGPDYSMKAPPDLLMARRNPEHATERAALFGKRLVVAIETGEGSRLNEVMVKELTGGDQITARRMREDFWSFWPTHKVFLCTNHKPTVRGTDHAIWRRLKLVPFTVTIPDAEQDRGLLDKLATEMPGILAWAVRGCLEWQEDGMNPPPEVEAATAEYRRDEDVLGSFLTEHCMVESGLQSQASALYARYRAWADPNCDRPLNQIKFGKAMTERGFERFSSNGIWYRGIGLRPDDSGWEITIP